MFFLREGGRGREKERKRERLNFGYLRKFVFSVRCGDNVREREEEEGGERGEGRGENG